MQAVSTVQILYAHARLPVISSATMCDTTRRPLRASAPGNAGSPAGRDARHIPLVRDRCVDCARRSNTTSVIFKIAGVRRDAKFHLAIIHREPLPLVFERLRTVDNGVSENHGSHATHQSTHFPFVLLLPKMPFFLTHTQLLKNLPNTDVRQTNPQSAPRASPTETRRGDPQNVRKT